MSLTFRRSTVPAVRTVGVTGALMAVGVAAVAALVAGLDTGPALIALVGIMAVVTFGLSPALATLLAVCLLYANVPTAFRGVAPGAQMFAGIFAIPLAVPFVHRLIRGAPPVFDLTFALMLAYVFVQLVSALGAADWQVAVLRIVQYVTEGVVLYWLLLQAIRTRAVLRLVLWTVVVTGAVLGSLSLYQQVSGDYTTQFGGLAQRQLRHDVEAAQAAVATGESFTASGGNDNGSLRTSRRARGPIEDPNRFAQMLLVALPWALWLAFHSRRHIPRVAARVIVCLIVATVAITYSRGAFITMALLLGALGAMRQVRPRRVLAIAAVSALLVVAFAPNYLRRMGTILNTAAIISDRPNVNPDGAIMGRATEVLAALWAFADHPLLGVGPGQYVPFYSESYQQRAEIKFRQLSRPREAHNLFASIGAETGVIGVGVFLAIFGSLFVRLKRARDYWARRDPELSTLAVACTFSLLAYLGTGLFLHMAYDRQLALLLGVAGAAVQVMRHDLRHRTALEGMHDRAA